VELSQDPVYSAFVLPALQAAKQAQKVAETQFLAEKKARQQAEAKLQQLEEELARLRSVK
jgi:cell shape-determining protein MreC